MRWNSFSVCDLCLCCRCGYDQQGTLAQSPASTDGVMGLSSSKVALPSQLAEQGIVNNVIGHCLAGGSNGGGYLFFGDELVPSWGMTWTPMMGRPAMYVPLQLNLIFLSQKLDVCTSSLEYILGVGPIVGTPSLADNFGRQIGSRVVSSC